MRYSRKVSRLVSVHHTIHILVSLLVAIRRASWVLGNSLRHVDRLGTARLGFTSGVSDSLSGGFGEGLGLVAAPSLLLAVQKPHLNQLTELEEVPGMHHKSNI